MSLLYKCAAYFTFYFIVAFSKKKYRVGFIVFFLIGLLKKNGWIFWVGSNYINPAK